MREFLKNELRAIRKNLLSFAIAIAIITVGVTIYVGFSLYVKNMRAQTELYFRELSFADVFVTVSGIPEGDLDILRSVPGVERVFGRQTEIVRIMRKDSEEQMSLLILAYDEQDTLNRIAIEDGIRVEDDTLLVAQAMQEIRGFAPGETITVTYEGNTMEMSYGGYMLSPEYTSYIPDAIMKAPVRDMYSVAAMRKETLSKLTGRRNMFNNIGIALTPGYTYEDVKDSLVEVLSDYGVINITDMNGQAAYELLIDEIDNFDSLSIILSGIFLMISAFMVYIIINKMVDSDRTIIGTMKAMGASNVELLLVYMLQSFVIAAGGFVLSFFLGKYVGSVLYYDSLNYYCMPDYGYTFYPRVALRGAIFSFGTVAVSTFIGLWNVLKITPAESMRVAEPSAGINVRFPDWLEKRLVFPKNIAVHGIFRNPLRTFVIVLIIAVSISLIGSITSVQTLLLYTGSGQLKYTEPYDYRLSLAEEQPWDRAVDSLENEYILEKEAMGVYDVEIRFGSKSRYRTLIALEDDNELYRVYNTHLKEVQIPEEGLTLSVITANNLGVKAGDTVYLRRPELQGEFVPVRVTCIAEEITGRGMYIRKDQTEKIFSKAFGANQLLIKVDREHADEVVGELSKGGGISYIVSTEKLIPEYDKVSDQAFALVQVLSFFATLVGLLMIYGIVSISVRERQQEIGTYMVLGTYNHEITDMLLLEQLLNFILGVVVSIPLTHAMILMFSDLMTNQVSYLRADFKLQAYLKAVGLCAFAMAAAMLMVVRSIKKIELTDVLKERM